MWLESRAHLALIFYTLSHQVLRWNLMPLASVSVILDARFEVLSIRFYVLFAILLKTLTTSGSWLYYELLADNLLGSKDRMSLSGNCLHGDVRWMQAGSSAPRTVDSDRVILSIYGQGLSRLCSLYCWKVLIRPNSSSFECISVNCQARCLFPSLVCRDALVNSS